MLVSSIHMYVIVQFISGANVAHGVHKIPRRVNNGSAAADGVPLGVREAMSR